MSQTKCVTLYITVNMLQTNTDAESDKFVTDGQCMLTILAPVLCQKSRKISKLQSLEQGYRGKCPHFWRHPNSVITLCRIH